MAELSGLRFGEQTKAAEAVLAHGLTWKEVIQLTQLSDRTRKPIEDCVAAVLKLRPEVEVRHLFLGTISSKKLQNKLQALPQRRRDELLEQALQTLLGHVGDLRGRLGVANFTITGSRNPAQILNKSADEFEALLADTLFRGEAIHGLPD